MPKILETIGKKGSWEILMVLYKNGESNFTDLQEKTKINTRTLSRRLKELREINLIKRIVNDDRTVNYTLTQKGKKIVDTLILLIEQDD